MILQKENETLSSALLRWSLEFNENLELDKKDVKTIENYMNVINKLIEYVSSDRNIDDNTRFEDIEAKFIKKYFAWRDKEHFKKNGSELKNSTKSNDKKILVIFFDFIEDENKEKIEHKVKWKKIRFTRESIEKDFLQKDLVALFLDYLEKNIKKERTEFAYTLSFCFKLALYGGMRATEICNLELQYFGNPYLTKDSKAKLIPLTIKGKGRTVYTNPIPYEYIKNEFNYFKRNKLDSDRMFLTKTGLPLKRTNLYGYFEHISKELNLGKKGVHIIRHTFANTLSEAGVDLRNIQNLLRHKDIKTTTIYTARSQSRMEEAITRL